MIRRRINNTPGKYPAIYKTILWEHRNGRKIRRAFITPTSHFSDKLLNKLDLKTFYGRERVANIIARGWLRNGERPAGTYYTVEHVE